jgi:hypothetical protein
MEGDLLICYLGNKHVAFSAFKSVSCYCNKTLELINFKTGKVLGGAQFQSFKAGPVALYPWQEHRAEKPAHIITMGGERK